jgi:hypothetical protein
MAVKNLLLLMGSIILPAVFMQPQAVNPRYVRIDTAKASVCSSSQYFDTTELACKTCPTNTMPNANSKHYISHLP